MRMSMENLLGEMVGGGGGRLSVFGLRAGHLGLGTFGKVIKRKWETMLSLTI